MNDTQKEICDVAKKFVREEIIPQSMQYDLSGAYPWDTIKKAWSLGLLTMHIPVKYGGMGSGIVDGSLIGEEIAYGCAGIGSAIGINGIAVSICILNTLPLLHIT